MNSNKRKAFAGLAFITALLVIGGLLGACSGGGAMAGADTRQTGVAGPAAVVVNVVTDEMSINFQTMPTRAGKITFVVSNRGSLAHNFVLEGRGETYQTKMISPHATDSITVDLAPGEYTFLCSVPGHALVGMRGGFTLS